MKYSPTEFLKIATNTAEHFGFRTADVVKKDPLCKNCEVSLPYSDTPEDKKNFSEQFLLTSSVSTFCNDNLHAIKAPVLLYSLEQLPQIDSTAVTFSIFNVQKSIAEAILIQAGRSLMQELGHEDHVVRINSLGDTESSTRYSRELTNFLRKRLDVMPVDARELMKEHPLLALMSLLNQEHDLAYSNGKQPARMPKGKSVNPEVYVVQLGFGPKVRSLMVIDQLKHAGIPVRHDLASDSLSAQLRDAEARGVRYTVIIGQKEFVDQTVILRDMRERNQENIPLDSMIKRLKKQLTVS